MTAVDFVAAVDFVVGVDSVVAADFVADYASPLVVAGSVSWAVDLLIPAVELL